MQQIKIKIYGRVQGVGFRYFVYLKAKKEGVNGYVRNMDDGTVEAIFEGDEGKLHEMVRACKRGPPLAKVDRIEIIGSKKINSPEYDDFKILY